MRVSSACRDGRVLENESYSPAIQCLANRLGFFITSRGWHRSALPVVQKPAVPAAILGVLKLVPLADARDVAM